MMQDETKTWFHAVAAGDMATIRTMIVGGIDVDMRDPEERSAFHIASQNADVDMMNTLLAARQMRFLRQIGYDPFAPAGVSSPAMPQKITKRA